MESKQQAHQVLSKGILVNIGTDKSVADLGRYVKWTERTEFDPTSPLPTPEPEDDEDEHKFLVASLDLRHFSAEAIHLRIADQTEQAVVFWVAEEASAEPVRWVMLIAGDHSMSVELPPNSPLNRKRFLMVLAAVTLCFFVAKALQFRVRRATS